MAMTMALGTSAFAASGFEFLLQAEGGINLGIPTKGTKDLDSKIKGQVGGGAGVDAQIGYMFQVKDGFGISVLGELGYSWDFIRMGYGNTGITTSTLNGVSKYDAENGVAIWGHYHSFKIGLLPKFNIGLGGRHGLAVGIGGGVKIPLSGTLFAGYSGIDAVKIFNDEKVNRTDISDLFSPSVIGYIKATFDYSFFFTDKIAMNFGLYLGYDFGMKIKNLTLGGNGIGGGAFNLGLQLGFRFGPKA